MTDDMTDGMFYEIEYDSCPIPGVGKYVLRPQRIEEPEHDEVRALFTQMRDIARAYRAAHDYSRFFDRRARRENAAIFYRQGMFMKDFTDSYEGEARFSQYFPSYQLMGYEQLRTYFTWRAAVRDGNVADTSPSYAFLYVYELLGNIGVSGPPEGLSRLMSFWKAYRVYFQAIDRYVLSWLKDYHIYYELPHSFKEFVDENGLSGHYPRITGCDGGSFGLFCAISKYDIRKSAFFTDDTCDMIAECFSFVMDRIRRDFAAAGMRFDDALFRPTRKLVPWTPFKDALFHQRLKQPDRRVVLSESEIYVCSKNEWSSGAVVTSEKGRRFIGYVMKRMEAVLRAAAKHKYKITAGTDMIDGDTVRILAKSGLHIEKIVPAAVMEFHRETTKTVVAVDFAALARIREEALATQEALTVGDEPASDGSSFVRASDAGGAPDAEGAPDAGDAAPAGGAPDAGGMLSQNVFADPPDTGPPGNGAAPLSYGWDGIRGDLGEDESQALAVILRGGDIKAFAETCGIMPEVLIDGINEKAMDHIGDTLIDENFAVYDDYIVQAG